MTREQRVWELLTRKFELGDEALRRAGLKTAARARAAAGKYQIFEVITAIVLSKVRPDYSWEVTPQSRDGGIDFIGSTQFLKSEPLGIDATIVIGGQCKKRDNPRQLMDEIGGSLLRMADSLNPTFFVTVFSALVSEARLRAAKGNIERQLHRDCHILARRQIEALLADHLDDIRPTLAAGLPPPELEIVAAYLRSRRSGGLLRITIPSEQLAASSGAPFRLSLRVDHGGPDAGPYRVRWMSAASGGELTLLVPSGASGEGVEARFGSDPLDPFSDRLDLEFLSYRSGTVPLGTIEIDAGDSSSRVNLPSVDIAPALRPSFFDKPFSGQLGEIRSALGEAGMGLPRVLAVTGAAGAGKTRLCQEAALVARRRGASYACAEQVNSLERPYRLFADLLLELAGAARPGEAPSERVLAAVARLQPRLAAEAEDAVRALVDSTGRSPAAGNEKLLSVFVLLAAARARVQPLIIHLQNLHWCTGDVLEFIERMIWQLLRLHAGDGVNAPLQPVRLLFLLEGRVAEQRGAAGEGWSTRAFEDLLQRMAWREVRCFPFTRSETSDFIAGLFEAPWSAQRRLPGALAAMQAELMERLGETSGSNPFHLLEQLRLLRQEGIVASNPATGLLYLSRPPLGAWKMPETALDAVRARWRYLQTENRALAELVAAAALVEDRLPRALFDHLWSSLASEATRGEINALEMFRPLPPAAEGDAEVGLRHENYYHALRDLPLSLEQRSRLLSAYIQWFDTVRPDGPEMVYLEARVRLMAEWPPTPETTAALRRAAASSASLRKPALAARINATLLDQVYWARSELPAETLLDACERELSLATYLISAGKRDVADQRLSQAGRRLEPLIAAVGDEPSRRALHFQRLALGTLLARAKFNNGEPVQAAAISARMAAELDFRAPDPAPGTEADIAMEVLNVEAVAAALSGELDRARAAGARAAALASASVPWDERALDVISTYGNILSAFDVPESLRLLEDCVERAEGQQASARTQERLNIHLSLVRIIAAARDSAGPAAGALEHTEGLLRSIQSEASAAGRFSASSAAALLTGVIVVLRGEDARRWFALAVAESSRARQLETLWRSQINLAHELDRAGESPLESALAALDILMASLAGPADPACSPRFRLAASPLATATGYCLAAGHPQGAATLERIPALRAFFADPDLGILKPEWLGVRHHQWVRVDGRDYVLY
ncbi:MAG TPA: AAA family ATPase [Allosphingosinicella sp.]|nr:AAA family ATPase [Allosphingosinicella sp.]